jgi:hypothetical protein
MQFIPSIEIEFCGPDGEQHKRNLRFDLAARRIIRQFYENKELAAGDPIEAAKALQKAIDQDAQIVPERFLIRALFALTYHERQDGETPESFEQFIGVQNMAYVGGKVREALGMGLDDEDEGVNPTTAPSGSVKRSRTGKRSKPSPKSGSESPQAASIQ